MSRVRDAQEVEQSLHRAVLTFLAVQGEPAQIRRPLTERVDELHVRRVEEPGVVSEVCE